MSGGGQYTDDSLLNSEQASVIGENKISSLSSGAITGDKNGILDYKLTMMSIFLKSLCFLHTFTVPWGGLY